MRGYSRGSGRWRALVLLPVTAALVISSAGAAPADPPAATTGAASAQGTGATVTGTVTGAGLSPAVAFSTDPGLAGATTVPARTTGDNKAGTQTVQTELLQLQLGTDYYYRVQASNQTQTVCGEIKKLRTWSLVLKLRGKVKVAPNHSPRPTTRLYFAASNDLLAPMTGTVTITGTTIMGNSRAASLVGPPTQAVRSPSQRRVLCRAKVRKGKASCQVRLRPARWRMVAAFVGDGWNGSGISAPREVAVRAR